MKFSKIELISAGIVISLTGLYFLNHKSDSEIECENIGGKYLNDTYCATTTMAECNDLGHTWSAKEELCFDEKGDVVLGVDKMPMSKFMKEILEENN